MEATGIHRVSLLILFCVSDLAGFSLKPSIVIRFSWIQTEEDFVFVKSDITAESEN